MSSPKKSSGGFKGMVATAITLILVASGVVGIAKVNNINSADDLYGFFKAWSDKVWECTEGQVDWRCETPLGGNSGSSGDNSGNRDNDSKDNGSSGNQGTENPGATKPKSSSEESLKQLEGLKISDENKDVSYNRSDWKHWTGSPCNTREEVLQEQGKDVKTDDKCRAVSGTWYDVYSKDTFTESGDLDIDHVIPLNYANSHGGAAWTNKQKEAFANDKSQLLAVSAGENRKKSDKGPSEYMPKNKDYHCDYSKIWVQTADKYDLSITEKDKKALKKGLNKCDA